MTQSLSGKNYGREAFWNLMGKRERESRRPTIEMMKLKSKIIQLFLLPLISKQWGQLYENRFFLENIKAKVEYYYRTHGWEDLLLYRDILRALDLVMTEHMQLEDLEKKIHSRQGEEFTSIVYKTTMIRLKPEYELYDTIFGKPKREKDQAYSEAILSCIRRLLNQENITFSQIQEQLIQQFPDFLNR